MQESLTGALGRAPSVDEVAESLGVDRRAAIEALAGASHTVSSLDETIADVVAAESATPEDAVLETGAHPLREGGGDEPPRADALHRRADLLPRPRSVGELATELGLTHSAVSQQRSEAIRLMRHGLESPVLDRRRAAARGAAEGRPGAPRGLPRAPRRDFDRADGPAVPRPHTCPTARLDHNRKLICPYFGANA